MVESLAERPLRRLGAGEDMLMSGPVKWYFLSRKGLTVGRGSVDKMETSAKRDSGGGWKLVATAESVTISRWAFCGRRK